MLDLMQFQMEELASVIGDRRVILEDMIVVEKDSLFCRSRGTKTRGINCLNRILRQTNWNGLTFRNVTTGDWYKELMSKPGSVLYRYTHFYTAANVHFSIKQVLQITHTSLAIRNSVMRSLVRGTTRPECLC